MKLTIDFTALENVIEKAVLTSIFYQPSVCIVDRTKGIFDDLALFGYLPDSLVLGDDVPFENITSEFGILEYMGNQIMLYKEDQNTDATKVLRYSGTGGPVHVAECKMVEDMRNGKESIDGYGVISRMDSKFPIRGYDSETKKIIEGDADFFVCKQCLELLNYKGYMHQTFGQKKALSEQFNFELFFNNYSSYFKYFPRSYILRQQKAFTKDWPSVSTQAKLKVQFCCENCNVNLKHNPSLLHTHHINGSTMDNDPSNLRVYCVDCHKKLSQHGFLHVKHCSVLEINKYRWEQRKTEQFNYQTLEKFSDSALEGFVYKCRQHNLPIPEIGLSVSYAGKQVDVDLAWPRKKIAILLTQTDEQTIESEEWQIFSAHQVLKDFNNFQKKIR